jgi:hypothetical protein
MGTLPGTLLGYSGNFRTKDMKKINAKVGYTTEGDTAKLYARYRNKVGPNPLVCFATCHIATIPLLKKDGVMAHSRLLKMNPINH